MAKLFPGPSVNNHVGMDLEDFIPFYYIKNDSLNFEIFKVVITGQYQE